MKIMRIFTSRRRLLTKWRKTRNESNRARYDRDRTTHEKNITECPGGGGGERGGLTRRNMLLDGGAEGGVLESEALGMRI